MNAREHRPRRIPKIRITPFQLWLLCAAVFFAAITPTRVQFILSGVMVAFAGVAMTVTNLRKEPAPPEVFLEEEHFEGGGTIQGNFVISESFLTSPQLRLLVLSPTADAFEFSLAYGLGRFFGPWILRRKDIAQVQRVRTWLYPHDGIKFVPVSGPPWYFSTREPGTVLACLEELSYPIASDAPK
ncbi:hypothetical protein ASG92_25240 [Arthrobacter sp. Soil736]|uniref:hypothetical protein n=1 Tax=Arthrobacter sp. Soil736 TaxID=1736395 RepID=UPI0006FE4741|nr:hypothetical protein [Arthrobacter sp. Soil736]KRE52436.1 hypothetical protein ASG92_25240 [Arthrobacter sp. Soil736]